MSLPSQTQMALAEMVESGAVDPIVGRTYSMEDAAQALAELDGRRATGKLVLRLGDGGS